MGSGPPIGKKGTEGYGRGGCGTPDLQAAYGLSASYCELIEGFTVWLVRRGYAHETIRGLRRRAGRACAWLAEWRGVGEIGELRGEDVAAYGEYLSEYVSQRTGRGLAAASVASRLEAVRLLDEYAAKYEGRERIVAALPEVGGAEPRERRALSRAEVAALYRAADGLDGDGGRYVGRTAHARAVLALLYGCGLRIGEACGLLASEVDLVGGRLLVRRAKNGHGRYVPLAGGVVRDLATWLRSDELGGERARYAVPRCGRVLVNRLGTPARPLSVNRALARLCGRAGVEHATAHCLRHSIATHLVASGMSLEAVARMLGHRSLETTKRYAHVGADSVGAGEVMPDDVAAGDVGEVGR